MDEGQTLLVPQAHRFGIGVVVHPGHQHHVGAVAAGGFDLGDGRTLGDTDGGPDAHVAGGIGHALSVVAGGAGDDAAGLLLVGEGGNFIVRAAELERAGLLQAVGLEVEVAARDDALGGHHGGAADDGGQHLLGVVEHIHRDHGETSFITLSNYPNRSGETPRSTARSRTPDPPARRPWRPDWRRVSTPARRGSCSRRWKDWGRAARPRTAARRRCRRGWGRTAASHRFCGRHPLPDGSGPCGPLSQAALEVLAVVAYNQPVTKAFVEQVRGVDCSGVIGSLTTKGLVEEKGRLELPGRPLLYGTTENFLRCFNISSLDELPPLPESDEDKESEENGEEQEKTENGNEQIDLLADQPVDRQ